MQQVHRLLGIEERWNKVKINNETHRSIQLKVPRLRPKLKTKSARVHSGAACDRPRTAKITGLSPIPEVFWQQPPEATVDHHELDNKHNDSARNTNQTTEELESKQINDVASQTLPPKTLQLQKSGTAAEQFREKIGNEQVSFLDNSNICPTGIHESRTHLMTTSDGDSSIAPITSQPHTRKKVWWEISRQTSSICH